MIICLSGKIRLCKKYQSTKMYLFKNIKNHVLKWFSSFSTSSSTLLFTIYRLTQLVTHTLKISQCYLPVVPEIWIQGKKFNPFLPVFSIQAISTWLHTLAKPHNIIYMYNIFWYACQYTAYWYKCIHTTGLHKKLVKVQNYQLI